MTLGDVTILPGGGRRRPPGSDPMEGHMESINEKAKRLACERYQRGYDDGAKMARDFNTNPGMSLIVRPERTRSADYWRGMTDAIRAHARTEPSRS